VAISKTTTKGGWQFNFLAYGGGVHLKQHKRGWRFIKKHKNVGVTIHDFTINLDRHNEIDVAVHSQWVAKGSWCNEEKGEYNYGKIVAFVTPFCCCLEMDTPPISEKVGLPPPFCCHFRHCHPYFLNAFSVLKADKC